LRMKCQLTKPLLFSMCILTVFGIYPESVA
jgi:hypothetical protein